MHKYNLLIKTYSRHNKLSMCELNSLEDTIKHVWLLNSIWLYITFWIKDYELNKFNWYKEYYERNMDNFKL